VENLILQPFDEKEGKIAELTNGLLPLLANI